VQHIDFAAQYKIKAVRGDLPLSKAIQGLGVVGAGAWGTALATVSARAGRATLLWARENEVVEAVNRVHENTVFLPGQPLDSRIRATSDYAALEGCDALLLVVPAQHLRAALKDLAPHVADGTPAVICSKGIEVKTLELMSDVLAEGLPQAVPAVLSGPSFAADVAKGLPTAVTLACADEKLGQALVEAIGLPSFRPYYSSDVTGAQIGGAVKNVMAIACGIVDGKGLGDSARAALIARGFAEIVRLGVHWGAELETLAGLSGLGDLILTCTSHQSRNYSLGHALGSGKSMEEALAGKKSVAEGVATASAVERAAEARGIEMPICNAIAKIVSGRIDVSAAIEELLSRPFKAE